MIVNQEERWLEELSYQLQLSDEITASGATMTASAATSDLRDWIDDTRTFLSVQYDDWQQVIGDFRDSLQQTGPKLFAVIGARRQAIDTLLTALISTNVTAGVARHTLDETVRSQLAVALDDLNETLRSDDALLAAWRDSSRPARLSRGHSRKSGSGETPYGRSRRTGDSKWADLPFTAH